MYYIYYTWYIYKPEWKPSAIVAGRSCRPLALQAIGVVGRSYLGKCGLTGAPGWGVSVPDLAVGRGAGVHTGRNRPSRAAPARARPKFCPKRTVKAERGSDAPKNKKKQTLAYDT